MSIDDKKPVVLQAPITEHPSSAWQSLYQRAEQAFREKALVTPDDNLDITSPHSTRQILHELQVFQIELEMQNDELRKSQLELDKSRARYFVLYDLAPVGYCSLNKHGEILETNLTLTQLLGETKSSLLKRPLNRLVYPEDADIFYLYRKQLLHGNETLSCELRMVKPDGSHFWVRLQTAATADDSLLMVVINIDQNRKDEEEINRLAFYDPLTNLPNRRLLFDRLKQAMLTSYRTDQHAALMFLDLDYFKQLNDSLGHDSGDLLLQQVAQRLQACVREGDSVARMGGDEFVLLLEALSVRPNEAAAQAEFLAHKVLNALGQPYSLHKHTYVITTSIGIVVFLKQSDSMEQLLKKADVAMYQAKAAGRNNARFFDPTMQAAARVRAELEKGMRKALEQQEFVMHYQLQVNAASIPTGVEALVRWNHSTHGVIPPNAFIPLAEETGMILPLGQWVLETACTQLAKWAHIPNRTQWTMAVNVSVSQFAQSSFVACVNTALQKTGANPHLLKLELTESMLAKDMDEVIIKMFEIKALGVTFSLDDFGTGYSSLSYLKRLPLDQLKIDQSFVRDLLTNANDAVIARTILALAHSLSLNVIAEGVETIEQRDALAEMGCDAYQGFYFARPVPAADLSTAVQNIPV
jgi:diguanylate cyclase (GGDEF)-like protein/PAS domain S-box-containing protein